MSAPLTGVRILEVSMFAPDAVGMHLADLGAEVIKVEAPGLGDPARLLGLPLDGESPATRRWNRGKYSIAIDLRSPDGASLFRELAAKSDAVVEGMRPGSLERRGLGHAALLETNPQLVFASVSGWGEQGPYRDLGAHGLAFDAWAGLAPPREDAGRPTRPEGHVWQGLEAGPLFAAFAIVSAILEARSGGRPRRIEVSQADAAAVWNGWHIAYEAAAHEEPESDPEARRAQLERIQALAASAELESPEGPEGSPANDVRYQYYAASDGHILLMATEKRFWKNFCEAIDRMDLFERWPGRSPADHDHGNEALRSELTAIFATRTRTAWIALFLEHDVAGAPVYEAGEAWQDAHFATRGLWTPAEIHGMRVPGSPLRIDGQIALAPRAAPKHGVDTDHVLRNVLGYDDARINELHKKQAVESKR
jgi:crotonobetainyl-CoA:carnitine CoA-transferase CaiB-like acyl-CoA transferase